MTIRTRPNSDSGGASDNASADVDNEEDSVGVLIVKYEFLPFFLKKYYASNAQRRRQGGAPRRRHY